jgi:transposase
MELYVGIDLHSNNSYIALLNTDQQVVYQKRLTNDLELILKELEPYRTDLVGVVVESTYNWYWLVDALQERGYQVHLAHPAASCQYTGLKHTDDNSDACWLAKQLQLNILETGYIYPKEQRGFREVLRQRMKLVRQQTQTLLRIQSQITRYTGKRLSGSQIKKLSLDEVKTYLTDSYVYKVIENQLEVMRAQVKAINQLEKIALFDLKKDTCFCLLKTVSGIGEILAMVIYVETGVITRFKDSGHYSSYCRCVESKRISNGKKKEQIIGKTAMLI